MIVLGTERFYVKQVIAGMTLTLGLSACMFQFHFESESETCMHE
jgi:hypothetical protein